MSKKSKSQKLDKKIRISISDKCLRRLNNKEDYVDQLLNIADSLDFDDEVKLILDCLKSDECNRWKKIVSSSTGRIKKRSI